MWRASSDWMDSPQVADPAAALGAAVAGMATKSRVADGALEHPVEVLVLLGLHGVVLEGGQPEGVVAVLGEVVLGGLDERVLQLDALRLPIEVAEPFVLTDPPAGAGPVRHCLVSPRP